MKTVTVDAKALRELLNALNGPAHFLGELQVTRSLHKLGHPNPIETLVEEFNAQVQAHNEGKSVGIHDAAFEAVRKKLCELPRYSFQIWEGRAVKRVLNATGLYIEFDDAHKLFDPVAVDAAQKEKPE